jgi:ABC-type molybdate transport system substrate-binding protein
MKRLRLLLASAIVAGWPAITSGSQAQDGKTLHVALAGTMEQVISRQIGPAFTAATGYALDITRQSSVLLANRIASGELTLDVYLSSDANVMELIMGPANNDRTRWYLPILRSRTVLTRRAKPLQQRHRSGQSRQTALARADAASRPGAQAAQSHDRCRRIPRDIRV